MIVFLVLFASFAGADPCDGPSAAWTFEGAADGWTPVAGGLRFVDSTMVPGTDGHALALGVEPGDAAYLTAPIDDSTRLGPSYTIEVWMHPSRFSAWNRIVLNWGAANQYAYHLALRDGRASLFHGQSNGQYVSCEGGFAQLDRWQQIVGVADAAAKSLRLYLDGECVGTAPYDGTIAATATEPLVLGDSDSLSSAELRFVGYLDSVTLWRSPLPDTEIAARYAAHPKSPPPPPVVLPADGEILFAERNPGRDPGGHYYADFGFNCGNEHEWLYGADGGRLAIYDPTTQAVRTLIEDPGGAFRDPCVHYDAQKVLFSYRRGGTHHYNLYEINLDGSGLTPITFGDWDDIEPAYLPDGDIVFISSRCKRYVVCWFAPVAVLFRCHGDGSGIRQLSSAVVTENSPAILPDGRILYTRWDYVNRCAVSFHHLWTMNPDGTGVAAYFGNMHPGGVFIDARPVPGSDQVVYVDSPGHGAPERAGSIHMLDPRHGPDDRSQTRAVTDFGFRDPYPLTPHEFLAAYHHQLVFVTGSGEVRTLWRSAMMVHEPRLIAPRPREPIVPSRVDPAGATGTLFLSDVHIGRHLEGLTPGTIKQLLVLEQLPKPVNFHGGGTTPIAHGGSWTLKRILGTVPVEADGSACFEVPAQRSLYFAALDEHGLSVKQMRSVLTVMPGEHLSCVGCHEQRTTPPPTTGVPLAARRAPDRIKPIAGVPQLLDFPRDIQPILDRHCGACHQPDQRAGGVDLSGDRGVTYSLAYYHLMLHRQIEDTAGYQWAGARNLGGRPAGNDAPYEAFSSAAPLMNKIDGSHHDVQLTSQEQTTIRLWLDSGAPYAGTYAAYGTGQLGGWWRNNEFIREMADDWPSTNPARDAITRRCTVCHDHRSIPRFVTDRTGVDPHEDFEGWMRPVFRTSRHAMFNLTRPEQSLVLKAPLAKSAGGYAEGELPPPTSVAANLHTAPQPIVHPVVFADSTDPDYQAILAHLQAAKTRLDALKRFDMPGFQPRYEYLREMRRYGVLPADFDLERPPPVDPYELDERYWQLFWPAPLRSASGRLSPDRRNAVSCARSSSAARPLPLTQVFTTWNAPAAEHPHAAPHVTSLTNAGVQYRVAEEHHVILRRGAVTAVIVDNAAIDIPELPGHRAGYNGVASLSHERRPANLFVPVVAGLNFEHIHDGTLSVAQEKFEPRRHPMELRVVDEFTVEVYQPPTANWRLESCGRYHLLPDGAIEYTFECIPRGELFRQGYIGLFWASYIDAPQDTAIHFMGRPRDAAGPGQWIRSVTPAHGVDSTHPPAAPHFVPHVDPEFPLTLVNHPSRYEYVEPWYFGVSHGMAFVQMFRARDHIWFAQSPTGGGNGNPAWDFQWFVPDYQVDRAYGFVMRAAYLPFESRDQLARLTERHRTALNPDPTP